MDIKKGDKENDGTLKLGSLLSNYSLNVYGIPWFMEYRNHSSMKKGLEMYNGLHPANKIIPKQEDPLDYLSKVIEFLSEDDLYKMVLETSPYIYNIRPEYADTFDKIIDKILTNSSKEALLRLEGISTPFPRLAERIGRKNLLDIPKTKKVAKDNQSKRRNFKITI